MQCTYWQIVDPTFVCVCGTGVSLRAYTLNLFFVMGFFFKIGSWASSSGPVILASQEAEIRRIVVLQSQPGQIVHETLSRKNPSQKRASGMARGVGLEFKPQYYN
jgi:hypothetical protein